MLEELIFLAGGFIISQTATKMKPIVGVYSPAWYLLVYAFILLVIAPMANGQRVNNPLYISGILCGMVAIILCLVTCYLQAGGIIA